MKNNYEEKIMLNELKEKEQKNCLGSFNQIL